MQFSVFCVMAAVMASEGSAVLLEQAAQNTPAINIIDNARIMMLPGSVPGMGCGGVMAQRLSENSSELDSILAQSGNLDDDRELLAQVSALVGLDTEAMLETFSSEAGLTEENLLAQLRYADSTDEFLNLVQIKRAESQ